MDLASWIILGAAALIIWKVTQSRRRAPQGQEIAPGIRIESVRFEAAPPDNRERIDLRKKPLPDGYRKLIQGAGVEVVGESHYRQAIEKHVGRRPEGHKTIVDAAMIAEPNNPHDPNAIAIQFDGVTVGYLARADAVRYGPVMDWCRAQGFVPSVRADVRGGWRKDDGSWADFGISLYVASPKDLLSKAVA